MWTKQQQEAIEAKGTNILVSAAAGSGKTAVLTERILQKLVSGEVQADRLAVVTFTKAAAAEMRERIRSGLESRFKKDPENRGLFVQMTLLDDADICTIDSFCNRIVRTHFEEAGTDPAFRVAEDAEMSLIMADVFSCVIEEFYKEGGAEFLEFVNAFSSAKNDSDIESMVYAVYEESQNKPWPEDWLDECSTYTDMYESTGSQKKISLSEINTEYIRLRIREYIAGTKAAIEKIYEGSGIEKYVPFIEAELKELEQICACKDPYDMYKRAFLMEFATIPRSAKGADEELKTLCKGLRDAYKKYIKKIVPASKEETPETEEDYYLNGRISKGDDEYIRSCTDIIIRLTKRFSECLENEKRKRNIVTFTDIEHMALDILIVHEDGKNRLTPAAEELKSFYHEILTDEYQDSNELQEEILQAISTGSNRYMVGDVKQSIYGFRGGEPGIFLKKYDEYKEKAEPNGTCIILQNNFRSRPGVLNACNKVFSAVMNREYTGISYDERERLVPSFEFERFTGEGMSFEGGNGKVSCEIIFMDEDEERENAQIEALRIAEIIKNYKEAGCMVYDTKKKCYRPICFRDFVVLVRITGYGSVIAEALNNADIPAYAESNSVYTDTFEVRPVMSFLKVIDNPLDDVSFTALMLSFFGGFTADELALLRAECKDEFFYRGLEELCEVCPEESIVLPGVSDAVANSVAFTDERLREKVSAFLKKIRDYREKASSESVYDLLWSIIYETGYYSYVETVPGSARRLANLDLFLNRAFMFTGTSYNGLFQFLRYMERIEETDKGAGEVSTVSELQDVVRVMTIHKSKGLEFPVVFLAGMEKRLNLTDATDRKKLIISNNYIVTDVYDTKRRVKRITAAKKGLQAQIKRKAVSEELRLLYVGFTRAVEKLYIIGTSSTDDISKTAGEALFYRANGKFGICDLEGATDYFRLFLPVILKDRCDGGELFEVIETWSKDVREQDATNFAGNPEFENFYSLSNDSATYSGEAKDKYISFVYPYEDAIYARPKVTVTELKRMSLADETEEALDYRAAFVEVGKRKDYAGFSEFTSGMPESAAGRGTIYHKFMEHLDFNKCKDTGQVEEQIENLKKSGIFSAAEAAVIRPEDFLAFAASDIGKRVAKAFGEGKVWREQQFMFMDDGTPDDVIVQGVADLCFEEQNSLVIVDYKTDKVNKRNGEKLLKKRYVKQLEIYARALSMAMGKPVKECIIYSFGLGREILI